MGISDSTFSGNALEANTSESAASSAVVRAGRAFNVACLCKAFIEAKALAMIDLCDVNALMVTLPWLEAETKETMAVMGADFWKYGVHENMPEIEALTQYAYGQGLIERKPAVEELFARPTFEMAKV